MKKTTLPILCGFAAMLLTAQARADYTYETDFSVPPYVLDQTIIGQQGWAHFGTTYAPDSSSVIVEVPWSLGNSALRLIKNEGSGQPRIRLYDSSIVPAQFTGILSITTSMAFELPDTHRTGTTGVVFANTANFLTPISFGLDHSSAGGLYYKGAGDNVVILTNAELKENSFYEFSLTINTATKLFDIQVTGVKNDNTPFSYLLTNITAGAGNFTGFYIESHRYSSGFTAYIGTGQIIPEPSVAAFGILGAVLLGVTSLRKRNRK